MGEVYNCDRETNWEMVLGLKVEEELSAQEGSKGQGESENQKR